MTKIGLLGKNFFCPLEHSTRKEDSYFLVWGSKGPQGPQGPHGKTKKPLPFDSGFVWEEIYLTTKD